VLEATDAGVILGTNIGHRREETLVVHKLLATTVIVSHINTNRFKFCMVLECWNIN